MYRPSSAASPSQPTDVLTTAFPMAQASRVKILDAWAMGKAVVSTSVGCEGLAAEDGRYILIRDDPDGFAQAVRAVLSDASLRQGLGAEGRRTVERLYSWDRIGESLVNVYLSVLESSQGSQSLLARAAG